MTLLVMPMAFSTQLSDSERKRKISADHAPYAKQTRTSSPPSFGLPNAATVLAQTAQDDAAVSGGGGGGRKHNAVSSQPPELQAEPSAHTAPKTVPHIKSQTRRKRRLRSAETGQHVDAATSAGPNTLGPMKLSLRGNQQRLQGPMSAQEGAAEASSQHGPLPGTGWESATAQAAPRTPTKRKSSSPGTNDERAPAEMSWRESVRDVHRFSPRKFIGDYKEVNSLLGALHFENRRRREALQRRQRRKEQRRAQRRHEAMLASSTSTSTAVAPRHSRHCQQPAAEPSKTAVAPDGPSHQS